MSKNRLNDTLFPEDSRWLEGYFDIVNDVFDVFSYLISAIKQDDPPAFEDEDYRNLFLLEDIVVRFEDPKDTSELTLHVAFADRKLVIKVPDCEGIDRDDMTHRYMMDYTPILKESQVRVVVLLWTLLTSDAREQIRNVMSQKKASTKK